jgi:hypothetical protein
MRALVSITIYLIALSISGQSTKNASLQKALDSYEKLLSITFSYDAELLNAVSKDILFDTTDIDLFKRQIEEGLPLRIVQVDEKYYTISAVETEFLLTIIDSIDNAPILDKSKVQVLVNRTPVETVFENGKWIFHYKPDVSNTVEVYSDGYMPSVISLEDLISTSNLKIALDLRTKYLTTIVIEDYLTKGINLSPSHQQIKINVEDLPLIPGETDGDIFASIAALPGITIPDGRAGNLFIRGSETDQSLILFDNIPVYHRGHYYGTISPYNPKVVKNVEVYRTGFHPRLGDRVGGAIVINSDQPNETEDSQFGIGANTLFGTMYGKASLGEKWGVSFGVRRSYSRSFESPKLEAISESVFAATAIVDARGRLTTKLDVLFEDYHSKISFNPNDRHQLNFTTLFTNSEVEYSPPITSGREKRFVQNKFDNLGFNFQWDSYITNEWGSKFSATYSDFNYQFKINQASPPPNRFFSKNRLKDINLKQEFSRHGELTDYQIGIDYKWQEVQTDYQNITQPDSLLYLLDDATLSHSVSPFMNVDFYGWHKWFFQLGIRSTYYSALEDFRVMPRFLVNYDATNWMTLKASAGMYNQYLSQVKNLEYGGGGFDNELWTLADDESGFIINGNQSTLGAVMNFDKWVVDVEAFNKNANNITVYEDRVLNPNSIYFTMDQQTRGVDLLVKREISADASVWIGYSNHDSKITLDTTDQVTYISKFVQPHVWYMGGSISKNRWKLSAGWKYSSGLNAQSLDIIYSKIIYEQMVAQNPEMPPPNPFIGLEDRYPNVYQLDISASYSIPKSEKRKWNASVGLSLINVLDQENLTDRAFRGRDGFVDRAAIGFAPNLMVLLEW